MYCHHRDYPREFYVTDPAIGHDVPCLHILDRTHPEGSEILTDYLAGKGAAFSKAALKAKGKGEGKGEDKGKGEGKGKDSDIPEADKASGRRRSRSRSRKHVEP